MVAIAYFSAPAQAIDINSVPNPRTSGRWVTDMENILNVETEAQINRLITELEAKNGTEIAVVTVPNTADYGSPKEFTTALFNHWGIGKQGVDNGILFMISTGDRRVEIETGYGIEGILPDAKVGNIIDQKIIPQFRVGNFEQGVLDGTKTLVFELSPADFPLQKFATRHWDWLLGLGGAGLFSGGLYKFLNRCRYVEPKGRSRCSLFSRPVYCKQCRQPMTQVKESLLEAQLTEVEKFSKNKKYLNLTAWQCPHCKPPGTLNFHILFSTNFGILQCPQCDGWTVQRNSKVILAPTYVSTGSRLVSKTCAYCDYHEEKIEIIPKRVRSSSSSRGSSSGGSFGGGSSGGGGAGGSWQMTPV
ncbi:hypothetical protein NIES970_05920 [[Synechococcus] sp. NIES-970]|nr:hypothetical protein NIES970_05920 [[Synechococcus] sp. NIES-970]